MAPGIAIAANGTRIEEGSTTSASDGSSGSGDDDAARLEDENARLKEELEQARSIDVAARSARRRRARSVAAGFLAVLTAISVFAATVGFWTRRTVSDPDRFVALVAPLASNTAVTDALAARLTDEIFTALDVQKRVQDTLAAIPDLPENVGFLAGPITAAAHNLVQTRVQDFLRSQTFQDLWADVTRALHAKVQALLNGDYDQLPNVDISGGEVRINLVSVVAQIVQQLAQEGVDALGIDVTVPSIPPSLESSAAIQQLGSALGVSLPPDFGQITIMSADQLSGYQETVQQLKRLYGALFLLSLLLMVATIVVAPNRRRAALWVGAGSAVALFLGAVFLRRLEANIVDAISASGAKAAARSIFVEVTSSLRGLALWVLVAAILVAIGAYVAGRPAWVERTRQAMTSRPEGSELEVWVAGHVDAVRIGGVVAAVVVLFLTGIGWLSVGIVGVLLALLLWGVNAAEGRAGGQAPSGDQP